MIDEQRCPQGKIGSVTVGLPQEAPRNGVAVLGRVPDPLRARLLAEELPVAITVDQIFRTPL